MISFLNYIKWGGIAIGVIAWTYFVYSYASNKCELRTEKEHTGIAKAVGDQARGTNTKERRNASTTNDIDRRAIELADSLRKRDDRGGSADVSPFTITACDNKVKSGTRK